MPIYEYVCPLCGTCFEEIRPASNPEPGICPECASPAARCPSTFHIRGPFRHMDWGKHDKIVSYPDGHTRAKSHNETYADGGI